MATPGDLHPEAQSNAPKHTMRRSVAAIIVVMVAAGGILVLAGRAHFNTPLHITITNDSGTNFTVELSLCDTFDCNVYWTELVTAFEGHAATVEASCVNGENVLRATIPGFHDALVIECGPGNASVGVQIGVNGIRISLVPP